MKNLLKTVELLMFLFSMFLFSKTEFAWWWYLVLILAPDVGMLGYLLNTKVGAITYNLFHHKGIAIAILAGSWIYQYPIMELVGIILFGHACMDRILGCELKYSDNFKHTHLGTL